MKGSIIAAREGDRLAARRAKRVARLLIDAHRSRRSGPTTTTAGSVVDPPVTTVQQGA
jgi:hypothetical protein